MKFAFIGARSLFFESVAAESASAPELHDTPVIFFDLDAEGGGSSSRVTQKIFDRWTQTQIYAQELWVDATAEQNHHKTIQALVCNLDSRETRNLFDSLVRTQENRIPSFRSI